MLLFFIESWTRTCIHQDDGAFLLLLKNLEFTGNHKKTAKIYNWIV